MPWEVHSSSRGWQPRVLSTLCLLLWWELPVGFTHPFPGPPQAGLPAQHPTSVQHHHCQCHCGLDLALMSWCMARLCHGDVDFGPLTWAGGLAMSPRQ